MSRLNKQLRTSVATLVAQNANKLKDKDIVEVIQKELSVTVSLGLVRKIRQDLGIVKSPGRGVCKVVDGVAAGNVSNDEENQPVEGKVPF